MVRLTLWLAILMMAVSPTGASTAASPGPGRLEQYRDFPSIHAAPRNLTIWLPPGYDPGGEPHAVLYMHDGQNLFDAATGFGGREWGVDEALARLIDEGAVGRTIVVGIWNTPQRLREYVPAKAFDQLPTGYMERVRRLYGGEPLSDGYLRFIVEELKPYIDGHYNTHGGRPHTAIMGSSMGGLISLYALAEYPHVFGAAGMVSTHWPLLLPADGEELSEQDRRSVAIAFENYLRASLPRPGHHRLYFDHGSETLDRHYAAYQERIDRLVASLGWTRDGDWVSRNYPGAAHNEEAWRARVDVPLRFLLPPGSGGASANRRGSTTDGEGEER